MSDAMIVPIGIILVVIAWNLNQIREAIEKLKK
jgi:hypothetical protein